MRPGASKDQDPLDRYAPLLAGDGKAASAASARHSEVRAWLQTRGLSAVELATDAPRDLELSPSELEVLALIMGAPRTAMPWTGSLAHATSASLASLVDRGVVVIGAHGLELARSALPTAGVLLFAARTIEVEAGRSNGTTPAVTFASVPGASVAVTASARGRSRITAIAEAEIPRRAAAAGYFDEAMDGSWSCSVSDRAHTPRSVSAWSALRSDGSGLTLTEHVPEANGSTRDSRPISVAAAREYVAAAASHPGLAVRLAGEPAPAEGRPWWRTPSWMIIWISLGLGVIAAAAAFVATGSLGESGALEAAGAFFAPAIIVGALKLNAWTDRIGARPSGPRVPSAFPSDYGLAADDALTRRR